MKKCMKLAVAALAVAGAGAGTTATAAEQMGVSKNEIVIGTIQDLSGPLAGFGKALRFGMQMRVDEVNEPRKTAENYRWQIRDRPVRIREGENSGYGDMESIIIGSYPGVTMV